MSYAEEQRASGRRGIGLLVVVALHVLVVYALVTGLARKAVEIVKGPIETKLIEELKKLPPPDDPPPPPPKPKAEPPPFVPPAEVSTAPVAVSHAPTITTSPQPAPVVVEAPPPPPPKPAVRVAAVIDAAANCRKPEYPAASKRLEEEGTVLLRFMIDEQGRVVDSRVENSSGFARLDEAARAALSQCKFKPGTVDGAPEKSWASLKYVWRLE